MATQLLQLDLDQVSLSMATQQLQIGSGKGSQLSNCSKVVRPIGGLSSAMAMLMVGGCHVVMPKFEAKSALEAMEQHHVTSLITVPAMLLQADIISLNKLHSCF